VPYPEPFHQPLVLAADSVRTFGGYDHHTDHPGSSAITGDPGPGIVRVGQVYVHSRVPVDIRGQPIVMIHGANRTGATFETTPDGREGWATWFVRHGHPVHVVDHAGRGRSGLDPTGINAVRAGAVNAEAPNLFLGTKARIWVNARIGPRYGEPFANVRFPVEAFDRMIDLTVPNAETTLDGGSEHTLTGVIGLLEQVGPAVLLVHSQGGLFGIEIARRRPDLVLVLVSIEGGSHTITLDLASSTFRKIPFLSVWGDNSEGAAGVNGDERRNGCIVAVANIDGVGGQAAWLSLPEIGIEGNSHVMMMDDNNLDIAERIRTWIESVETSG
jgi:pimeloyl-ACP methyl ester carboxylesterase